MNFWNISHLGPFQDFIGLNKLNLIKHNHRDNMCKNDLKPNSLRKIILHNDDVSDYHKI